MGLHKEFSARHSRIYFVTFWFTSPLSTAASYYDFRDPDVFNFRTGIKTE